MRRQLEPKSSLTVQPIITKGSGGQETPATVLMRHQPDLGIKNPYA